MEGLPFWSWGQGMEKTVRMPDCHELATQGWVEISLGAVHLSDRVAVPRAPWCGELGDCALLEVGLTLSVSSRMVQSKGAAATGEA